MFPVSLGAFDAEKLNIMTTSPFIETEIYLLANKDVHNNLGNRNSGRSLRSTQGST